MTRKRRQRARKQIAPSTLGASLATPTVEPAPSDAARGPGVGALVAFVGRYVLAMLCWLSVFLLVVFLSVLGILRWLSPAGTWPTCGEVGLSGQLALVVAIALTMSSVSVRVAHRALHQGRRRAGRVVRFVALLLVFSVLVLRASEVRTLYREGISPWNPRGSLFDGADVYYVRAVKARLTQLNQELSERQSSRPYDVADKDRRRLDLVATLQNSLVAWTEQEVGHWLDETQLRRELMEVLAYQVHPTARCRKMARDRMDVEQGDLARRREWFAVLRDYCRQQPAADQQALSARLAETLKRLGASQWAFADAVVRDAGDATMVAERLNQINLSLASIDDRDRFVREYVDPLWDEPAASGLNRQFPWLRLPVSFPNARAWVASYVLLVGLHSVMLVLAMLVLIGLPDSRGMSPVAATAGSLAPFWHVMVGCGIVVCVVVYGG